MKTVLSFVRPALRASLALAALAAAACPSPFGPDRERRPAVIELSPGDPVQVVLPAAATAGVPFEVRVTTYGGGCVAPGPTGVRVEGSIAFVEPYQMVTAGRDVVCTMELRIDVSTAQVRFDAPGQAVVVVRGYSELSNRMIDVQHTVEVR